MSERKITLSMTEARARHLREGISRIRFWIDGFRAAGKDHGVSTIETTLIALQIEFDNAIAKRKP